MTYRAFFFFFFFLPPSSSVLLTLTGDYRSCGQDGFYVALSSCIPGMASSLLSGKPDQKKRIELSSVNKRTGVESVCWCYAKSQP